MNLPTSEDHDEIFEQMGQLFIDCYEELAATLDATKSQGVTEYSATTGSKKLVDFQMRYTAIVKEYQEGLFAQPSELEKEGTDQ